VTNDLTPLTWRNYTISETSYDILAGAAKLDYPWKSNIRRLEGEHYCVPYGIAEA